MAKSIEMKLFLSSRAALATLLLCGSCNILPGGISSSGVCQSSEGSAVNTYTIYGTWKKVYGYEDYRSETELTENFHVLAMLRTGEACQIDFVNGTDTGVRLVHQAYDHDLELKTLVLEDLSDNSQKTATYSFSGSCADTKMTFTFEDGSTEIYKYRSKNLENVVCSSSE